MSANCIDHTYYTAKRAEEETMAGYSHALKERAGHKAGLLAAIDDILDIEDVRDVLKLMVQEL